jgi:hypothetical protein
MPFNPGYPQRQAIGAVCQFYLCLYAYDIATHLRENNMFRAIAGLLFIVLILPVAAFIASLAMKAVGADGLLGFIIGFPVFIGILTISVMILATINDRIYNRGQNSKAHNRTHTHGVH